MDDVIIPEKEITLAHFELLIKEKLAAFHKKILQEMEEYPDHFEDKGVQFKAE